MNHVKQKQFRIVGFIVAGSLIIIGIIMYVVGWP